MAQTIAIGETACKFSKGILTNLPTQTGASTIDMSRVTAIVRHLPRERTNIDLHMRNGSIFVVVDVEGAVYDKLVDLMISTRD
jgi:uncharacterized protein YcgI (DUF1989 family)